MKRLSIPVPHLNGNRRSDLLDSYCDQLSALRGARESLCSGDGLNMRNYYQRPNGTEEGTMARKQHVYRLEVLDGLIAEIEAIAEAIADGKDFAEVPS